MEPDARFEARAREPVGRALMRKLMVPKIYFDAHWPDADRQTDVVAINRAGAGDVHVVEVRRKLSKPIVASVAARLMATPAHYRWIAFERPKRRPAVPLAIPDPEEGEGRIGLIEIVTLPDGSLGANIERSAERFHLDLDETARSFIRHTKPTLKYA